MGTTDILILLPEQIEHCELILEAWADITAAVYLVSEAIVQFRTQLSIDPYITTRHMKVWKIQKDEIEC